MGGCYSTPVLWAWEPQLVVWSQTSPDSVSGKILSLQVAWVSGAEQVPMRKPKWIWGRSTPVSKELVKKQALYVETEGFENHTENRVLGNSPTRVSLGQARRHLTFSFSSFLLLSSLQTAF